MGLLSTLDGGHTSSEKTLAAKINTTQPCILAVDEHWITFGNIKCYDSRDEIFEAYPKIQLSRTFTPAPDSRIHSMRDIAERIRTPDTFLPSMPLLCQLLITLYNNKCYTLLDEFDAACIDPANIPLNTLVNYVDSRFTHYPSCMPNARPHSSNICIPFDEAQIVWQAYFNATRDGISPLCMSYVQNVTGLTTPDELVTLFSSMKKNFSLHVKTKRCSSNVVETLSLLKGESSYNFTVAKGFQDYQIPLVRIPQNDIAQ